MKFPVSQPSLTSREREWLLKAFDSGRISSGRMVDEFETMLASFIYTQHAVTTTSGTTALHLALAALGVGPGDEVIVPDLTYVATADAVHYTGATPVYVDIDPQTYGLDAQCVANAINRRTRAIIPVHLYGVSCDMNALMSLARDYKLWVVEDAAQGFGGDYHGEALGSIGDIGCFSFFGNKMITTGEGGACVTNNKQLAERMRHLRGMATVRRGEYFHDGVGFNYRMTDLQAALGIAQLSRLPQMFAARMDVYRRYQRNLGLIFRTQRPLLDTQLAPWLFTFETKSVQHIREGLRAHGIDARPGFRTMHEIFGAHGNFPVSVHVSETTLSLPTYVDLALSDVDMISNVVREFVI